MAEVINDNEPDAVALQELTGKDQLRLLLTHLKDRYRGHVCSPGSADRTDAVLIKNNGGGNVRNGADLTLVGSSVRRAYPVQPCEVRRPGNTHGFCYGVTPQLARKERSSGWSEKAAPARA